MENSTPQKVCPVVVRQSASGMEILTFRHPEAGNQLVKGTTKPDEAAKDAARRELLEGSGIHADGKFLDLGQSKGIVQGAVWHFFLCPCPPLPTDWSHDCTDERGQVSRFFWQSFDEYWDDDWDPAFIRAARHAEARIKKLSPQQLGEYCPAPRTDIAKTIQDLAIERGSEKSFSPDEVARALAGNNEKEWRTLMKPIRTEAVRLALDGQLVITRKGKIIDPSDFKGLYRLALPKPG